MVWNLDFMYRTAWLRTTFSSIWDIRWWCTLAPMEMFLATIIQHSPIRVKRQLDTGRYFSAWTLCLFQFVWRKYSAGNNCFRLLGPSGPYNTFLRNRIESESVCLEDSSNYQNFIGNEIVNGNILWDTDNRYPHKIDPSTLFLHGNLINGSIQWNQQTQDRTIPNSYYLDSKPAFFGGINWPSTGSDRTDGTIPAKERYYGNTIPPASPTPDKPVKYGDLNGDTMSTQRIWHCWRDTWQGSLMISSSGRQCKCWRKRRRKNKLHWLFSNDKVYLRIIDKFPAEKS